MALGRTNINLTEIPTGYEQLVNYSILYDNGEEYADITGGWGTAYYNATYSSKGTTYLNCGTTNTSSSYTWCSGFATLNNTIKVNTSTKVGVVYTPITFGGSNCWVDFALRASYTSADYRNTAVNSEVEDIIISGLTANKKYFSQKAFASEATGSLYVVAGKYAVASKVSVNIHTIMLLDSDDWVTLASKAGITASSIDDILTASSTLLANRDAVRFMTAQCTGDFMASAIASDTFLTALESSPYKTIVQANEHWSKFLAMVA